VGVCSVSSITTWLGGMPKSSSSCRVPRLVRGFEQGFRGDVEEQLARQLLLVEAPAGAFAAGDFQFAQAPGLAGDGEQCNRGVQRAVGRAAAEGFVAENASFRKADDRLEQAVQTALSQD
jgi:hypothetical protein